MILVIVISMAFFVACDIKTYVRKRNIMENKMRVIILQQQAEIGELKNRIVELELELK